MVLQMVSRRPAEACPPPYVNTTNKLQPFGHRRGKKSATRPMRFEPAGDLDLVADLRGLLARDVPLAFVPALAAFLALAAGSPVPLARDVRLAFGFALLSVIIRPFFVK